jgi:hypothetical protein
MIKDILHRDKQINQHRKIDFKPEMYNEALLLIQDLCILILKFKFAVDTS